MRLAIKKGLAQTSPLFSLRIHQESEDIFTAETDLDKRLSIDKTRAHKLIESGMLGIAHLTQTIGEMKAYSALNGFRDEELPLFNDKLDFLADAVSSNSRERNFQRVIEIANLPIFTNKSPINIDHLMKIRNSPETREFRDWLLSIGMASDGEIKDRVASMQALIGLKVNSRAGQAIRFLTLNAISFISHLNPLATAALGAIDLFVANQLFPRSGIAAFVNELYPSIFEQPKDLSNSQILERVDQDNK